MNIIDRILQFIEYKGISANKLSGIIDVSNAYFSKQKKNNANIGSHIIEKIVREFPELNLDWLITGEGEMLKEEEKECEQGTIPNNAIQNGHSSNISISSEKNEIEKLKLEIEYLKRENELLRTFINK